ncbi:MAG: hypothetical protein KDD64_10920 [Bdellovibrionales bacterium]|nr:hypothetical protein [Bdellovibrionales bacterium]
MNSAVVRNLHVTVATIASALSTASFSASAGVTQPDSPQPQNAPTPASPTKADPPETQPESQQTQDSAEQQPEETPPLSRWARWRKAAADAASDAASALQGGSMSAYERARAAAQQAGNYASQGYSASSTWMTETKDSVARLAGEQIDSVSITWEDLQVLENTQSLLARAESAAATGVEMGGREANRLAAIGIDALGDDPSADPSFQTAATNFALNKLPVVGAANKYSDACKEWMLGKQLFEQSQLEQDETKKAEMTVSSLTLMDSARKHALVACLDAGLDVATLGAATGVKGFQDADGLVNLLNTVNSFANLSDKVSVAAKLFGSDSGINMKDWNLSLYDPLCRLALSDPRVGGFIDGTLNYGELVMIKAAAEKALRELPETSETEEAPAESR